MMPNLIRSWQVSKFMMVFFVRTAFLDRTFRHNVDKASLIIGKLKFYISKFVYPSFAGVRQFVHLGKQWLVG